MSDQKNGIKLILLKNIRKALPFLKGCPHLRSDKVPGCGDGLLFHSPDLKPLELAMSLFLPIFAPKAFQYDAQQAPHWVTGFSEDHRK